MPFGIKIIMKKNKKHFTNTGSLQDLIQGYFDYIEGEYHLEKIPPKKPTVPDELIDQKIWDREPEPATIAGLAFFLGFNSREEFDNYESTGKFASVIKRARLRVEVGYEKKLHYQSSTGAMFALKNMGWNEKVEKQPAIENSKSIKVKIVESGPIPASNEKEVSL